MNPRATHIFSGIGVLLTSFVYVHIVHHMFVVHWNEFSLTWRALGLAIMMPVGVLSFIGAYLLLTGGPRPSELKN
jgi:hypothetical protein